MAAAQAGDFGVPLVFVSGDDAAIGQMRTLIPGFITVETKQALGFHSALTLTPPEAADRIAAGVREAVLRAKEIKPYVLKAPLTLELSYKHYAAAEAMSLLRVVQRPAARTIRYVAKDMAEIGDFLQFADLCNSDLTP